MSDNIETRSGYSPLYKDMSSMAGGNQSIVIEGFVVDQAFDDQSKTINGVLLDESGKVGSLTPKALSYFTTPGIFVDSRLPSTRAVNWTASTQPKMIIDEVAFSAFVGVVNNLATPVTTGLFKLIDKLLFDYDTNVTHADIEAFLVGDTDISPIYVAGSFGISTTIVSDKVYPSAGGSPTISVPASVSFSIELPTGQTTTTYSLTLFTSVDAWLTGYSISSVVKVIPPLPYDKLYSSSLINSTDSIFTTASTSATLDFSSVQSVLGSTSVSGITEYNAVLVEGTNSISVPFNLLYKGRSPTLFEIRNAIQAALLNSGVGNQAGWQVRIPGVFVSGRFYIIPLWSETYPKPDQVIFPNVIPYTDYGTITSQIVNSLGFGDVTSFLDVLSIYYNRMSATAIPDMSGTVGVQHLSAVIPDYQNYAPSDENFSYMLANTQAFAATLNTILALDANAQTSPIYTPVTENLLTFYSFTVETYEICVITKLCYERIMGSSQ